MWRIGFLAWRAWVYIKFGVPALALLALIYHAQGPSLLFGITALLVTGGLFGVRFVLRDLAQKEDLDRDRTPR